MTITAKQVERAIQLAYIPSDADQCWGNEEDITAAIALFRQYVAQQPKWEKCRGVIPTETVARGLIAPYPILPVIVFVDGQWYRFDLPEVPK